VTHGWGHQAVNALGLAPLSPETKWIWNKF